MPPNTVKVDRSTKFGNPWTVAGAREAGFVGTDDELRQMCAGFFSNAMQRGLPETDRHRANIEWLRGKNLACWCRLEQPCHADVLLEIANP